MDNTVTDYFHHHRIFYWAACYKALTRNSYFLWQRACTGAGGEGIYHGLCLRAPVLTKIPVGIPTLLGSCWFWSPWPSCHKGFLELPSLSLDSNFSFKIRSRLLPEGLQAFMQIKFLMAFLNVPKEVCKLVHTYPAPIVWFTKLLAKYKGRRLLKGRRQ